MIAEIILDADVHDLVTWLARRHQLESVLRNEYISLKPRVVDGHFEMKILVSSESSPAEWMALPKIQDEWEEESNQVGNHRPMASIVVIKDKEMVSCKTRLEAYAKDDFIIFAKQNGATKEEADKALENGKFAKNGVEIYYKKTM